MKKSILLIIGVIYILSIVAVSFYGLSIKNYHENKYPDSIALLNQTDEENGIRVVKSGASSELYDTILIYVNLSKTSSIKLECELTRKDGVEVTNKNIDYYVTNSTEVGGLYNDYFSVASDGTVTFTGVVGGASLLIQSSAKDTVKVMVKFIIKSN